MSSILLILSLFLSFAPSEEAPENGEIRFKDSSKSLIDFEKSDPDDLLNIDNWLNEQKIFTSKADRRRYFQERNIQELMGKVIRCVGECQLYRGKKYAKAQFLSQIYEGDLLKTNKGGYALVMLIDGSMVRVAEHTSLSFNEVNLSEEDFFFYIRLNEGHIHWQVRLENKIKSDFLADTDSLFQPIMLPEANREYYELMLYSSKSQEEKMLYFLDNTAQYTAQLNKLNQLIESNNPLRQTRKNTSLFLVAPNFTLSMKNPIFEAIYVVAGSGYIRTDAYNDQFEGEVNLNSKYQLSLRGYEVFESAEISGKQWHIVDEFGKSYQSNFESKDLNLFSLLTKRTPSTWLSRELMFKDFQALYQPLERKKLAEEHGYSLWLQKDIERRILFLNEYTRRTETSNLVSLKKLMADSVQKELVPLKDLSLSYNADALSSHFQFISGRKLKQREYVKFYSEKEYYYWMLHYAK
ncbi:MAG: hypothetical protein JNM93_13485 [Bacteriovoracaceae bacterium]|nr:hypothetical protein [Bacteriovoracaceae bacterium]